MKAWEVHFALVGAVTSFAVLAACGDDDSGSADNPPGDAGDAQPNGPPQRAEFGLDTRPPNATCKAPARPPSTTPVTFQRVYANLALDTPMLAVQRPGDASRWYVAHRAGAITYFASSNPTGEVTAANLANATLAGAPGITDVGEGGLLGFAFHPQFATNGKAYVSFTAPPRAGGPAGSTMQSVLAELTSGNGGDTFTTYKTLLIFDQTTETNHKGGGVAFGKDGYLYASFGDGGGGDDQFINGQTKTGFFSKILRIDVNNVPGGRTYGVPNDNPFAGGGGEPATFAYGFRNPFRFSFDRESGDLWVGDVGEDAWEEIDLVKLGGNYGWPCREGKNDHLVDDAARCPSKVGTVDPVVEHQHVAPFTARSITGGVVYRGKAIPNFVGTYVYGDFVTQELWGLSLNPDTGAATTTPLNAAGPSADWVSFTEDADGEVYAVALGQGSMYKLVLAPGGQPDTFPELLSKTGCVDAVDPKKPATGLVPYGVNAQLWSDGAEKERFIALPDGQSITVNVDGDFDLPIGSVVVKSFKLGGKFIETRLFIRHDDGGWAGYTYEWNDAETDATLLRANKTKLVGSQSWYYPSRSDCARCHTEAAGRTLGLELGQLNGDFVYKGTNRISNQLKTFEHIAMLAAPLGKPIEQLPLIPSPDGTAPLEQRARAFLHANCSNCHRPQGGGRSNMDLRSTQTMRETRTCNVNPEAGDLGIPGAKLLAPGDPTRSLLSIRPHRQGANRMPPLATTVVDDKEISIVDAWIQSVTTCP